MIDEVAIQQLLNRYTDGASRGDRQQVLSTFTPDAVVESSGVRLEGPEAIEAATNAYLAKFAHLVQLASPALIAVDGDRAIACAVIRETARYAEADEMLEVLGTYSDDLIRTADGWKIARRCFSALGAHRYPAVPVTVFP